MDLRRTHEWIYLLNGTVLLVHQIDGAYWHEWNLFAMPGGIQLYLALNLPIVLLVLFGMRVLGTGSRSGAIMSVLLIAAGAFAVVFHTTHFMSGDQRFTLPTSIALLVATALLTLAQAFVLLRLQRRTAGVTATEPS